jgi:hypothetical protein
MASETAWTRAVLLRRTILKGKVLDFSYHNSPVLANSHSQAQVPSSSKLSVIVRERSKREQIPILDSKFSVIAAVHLEAWRINEYGEGDGAWEEGVQGR